MTDSLQVLAYGTGDTREKIAMDVANIMAGQLDTHVFYTQVCSPSEHVRLQAATRHAMHVAAHRSTGVAAVCGIDNANNQSGAGNKRKRDDDVARFVYVVVAPV